MKRITSIISLTVVSLLILSLISYAGGKIDITDLRTSFCINST